MRRLTTTDYRRMRWKNGGGMTTEIALEPRADGPEGAFTWRVSIADVESDGPFSTFPGCDRMIMLLEGAGMSIDAGEHGRIELASPLMPRRFSGDWTVFGRLIDGPVKDFNLIFSRDLVEASLEVVWVKQSSGERPLIRPAGHLLPDGEKGTMPPQPTPRPDGERVADARGAEARQRRQGRLLCPPGEGDVALLHVLSGGVTVGAVGAVAGETIVAGAGDGDIAVSGDGRLAVARFVPRTGRA